MVAWLQALPKDEDGLPIGADSSLYSNNDVRSILEALFTHWQRYLLFPGDHGWSTDHDRHETDGAPRSDRSAIGGPYMCMSMQRPARPSGPRR